MRRDEDNDQGPDALYGVPPTAARYTKIVPRLAVSLILFIHCRSKRFSNTIDVIYKFSETLGNIYVPKHPSTVAKAGIILGTKGGIIY